MTANLITTLQRKDQETSGVTIGEFSNLSPYEMLLNEDGSYATNLNVYNRAELEKLPLENYLIVIGHTICFVKCVGVNIRLQIQCIVFSWG